MVHGSIIVQILSQCVGFYIIKDPYTIEYDPLIYKLYFICHFYNVGFSLSNTPSHVSHVQPNFLSQHVKQIDKPILTLKIETGQTKVGLHQTVGGNSIEIFLMATYETQSQQMTN